MPNHLLGIAELTKEELMAFVENGYHFIEVSERSIKKVPTLRGKTIINFFAEASTRTRASFEIAGKRLSADTINLGGSGTSQSKGETLYDTLQTLQAMNPDIVVLRHSGSGAPHFLARSLPRTSIVNAGDGAHEHPTQALLDCVTLYDHFKREGRSLEGLKIAIVGDILHSRVARSNIYAHGLLGNTVHLVGPPPFVPKEFETAYKGKANVKVFHSIEEGLRGVDVVLVLRMQLERHDESFISSLEEYTRWYFVSRKLLSRIAPGAVVLHPGPINRGVEVETALIDGPQSLVTKQVTHGVAVRMAVLHYLCKTQAKLSNEVGEK